MDERLIGDDRGVVFELATHGAATHLYRRLAPARTTWQLDVGEAWAVGTEVGEGDDLAQLLREVERWVAVHRLGALRYWVDGRDYILQAGEVRSPAVVLAAAAPRAR